MENKEIFQYFLDKLIEISLGGITRLAKKDDSLPNFSIKTWFCTLDDSNPQLFYINITNHSTNDYLLKKSLLIKRNNKRNNPIVIFNPKMLKPKEKTTIENIQKDGIAHQLTKLTQIDELIVKAKRSEQLVVVLELDFKTHEYWKNFELGYIPGFVSDKGKIFPAWRPPKYEWELLFKDEKNYFWSGDKIVPIQIYYQKLILFNELKKKIETGQMISIFDLLNYNLSIVKKQFKLLYFLALVKLKYVHSLPERI